MSEPLTNEEYLEADGQVCPECGKGTITPEGMLQLANDRTVIQTIICRACGNRWTDIYKLTGYKPGRIYDTSSI